MKSRVCVLVSGGVDSSILLADWLGRGYEVYPLYVSAGFKWEKAELIWLRRLLKRLKTPRLKPLTVVQAPLRPLLKNHWGLTGRGVPKKGTPDENVYIPGRNLALLAQAGLFCALRRIPVIALATLKCNPFPDARPEFFESMGRAISAALDFRVQIIVPYSRLMKADVIKRVPGFPLSLTFSCLNPKASRHCGRCNKCEERRGILA